MYIEFDALKAWVDTCRKYIGIAMESNKSASICILCIQRGLVFAY